MRGARPVVDVGARARGLVLIDEGAFEDEEVFAVEVMIDLRYLVAGVPLDENRPLARLRICKKLLATRTWCHFLPCDGVAVDVGDEVVGRDGGHGVILLVTGDSPQA